jgi:hypothetical protein
VSDASGPHINKHVSACILICLYLLLLCDCLSLLNEVVSMQKAHFKRKRIKDHIMTAATIRQITQLPNQCRDFAEQAATSSEQRVDSRLAILSAAADLVCGKLN